MVSDQPPEHMDRWTRNERLYRHLLAMGLVAVPIFEDDDRTRIDHLWVSVDLPDAFEGVLIGAESPQTRQGVAAIVEQAGAGAAQGAAERSIVAPVEGPQVVETVAAPKDAGNSVVNFPPILGRPVAVVGPTDDRAERVPPPD